MLNNHEAASEMMRREMQQEAGLARHTLPVKPAFFHAEEMNYSCEFFFRPGQSLRSKKHQR